PGSVPTPPGAVGVPLPPERYGRPVGSFVHVTIVAPATGPPSLPEQSHKPSSSTGSTDSRPSSLKATRYAPAVVAVTPGGNTSVTVTGPLLPAAPILRTLTWITPCF